MIPYILGTIVSGKGGYRVKSGLFRGPLGPSFPVRFDNELRSWPLVPWEKWSRCSQASGPCGLGFRGLGCRGLGFRGLGFRVLGF